MAKQTYQGIDLTPRELRVLQLVAEGYTTKKIAKEVILAEKTVEHMLGRKDVSRALYRKLGVRNRASGCCLVCRR